MEKFIIIAPVSALSRRLRLYKLVMFIKKNKPNWHVNHIGWERNEGEAQENMLTNTPIDKKILLKGGGYGGAKVKLMYFLWMLKVFIYSFSIPKGTKVWALGFESAFPLLLMSKIKKYDLYFDDADRFSMVFKFPKIIKSCIEKLEVLTSRNVYKHIVPSLSRYNFNSDKLFILRNLPSEDELNKAKEIFNERQWPKAKLIIYVNGWLGRDRGMDIALKLSEHFSKEDLIILLAGRIDCDEAKTLSEQENVVYLGNLSNAEALAGYYASDYVLTYFSPKVEINRLAESNKWGDALATGCGVIVNTEVESFNYENLESIRFPYDNVESLVVFLKNINFKEKKSIKLEDFFEKNLDKLFSHNFHRG